MATQLSKQLKQLQSDKLRGNLRASLLFTSREAAEYDVATIHGIGLNGLAELLQLDPTSFAPFQKGIFGSAYSGVDRETATQDVGNDINQQISAFARAVCPYMQLKAAHKCLEWLIRRFKAHVYNIDALMEAALPHSDSVIFGRLVQILELGGSREALGPGSASVSLWHFLVPNQKTGAPLPREVLSRQCLKDPAVLRFVCDIASRSCEASRAGLAKADAALGWWSVTVCDVVTRATTVTDDLLAALLPYVLEGVKDGTVEGRRDAAYAVLAACLAGHRAAASRKLLSGLVQAIIANADSTEPATALATLLAVFAGQAHHQQVLDVGSQASEEGQGEAGTWLRTFRLEAALVARIYGWAAWKQALAELVAEKNGLPFLSCLLHSALACLPELASGAQGQSAEEVCGQTARLLMMLGKDTVAWLAPALTRTMLLTVASSPSSPVCAPLGRVLKALSEVSRREVDEALRAAMGQAHAQGQGQGLDLGPSLAWVSRALQDSESMPLTLQDTGAGAGASSSAPNGTSGLSVRLALEHPSPLVRQAAVDSLHSQATRLAGLVEHGPGHEDEDAAMEGTEAMLPLVQQLSGSLKTVADGLATAAQDHDSWVVARAVAVYAYLLQHDIVAVLLEAGLQHGDEATLELRRYGLLLDRVAGLLAKWTPVALIRIEGLLPAGGQGAAASSSAAAEGVDADGATAGASSNRKAQREARKILKDKDGMAASGSSEAGAGVAVGSDGVAPEVRARIRTVLGARRVVTDCLAVLTGPIAARMASPDFAGHAISGAACRSITSAVLSLLPVGAEAVPAAPVAAALPVGTLGAKEAIPPHPANAAVTAAAALAATPSTFPLFSFLGQASGGTGSLNCTALLACAVLKAAVSSSSTALAETLLPVLDAASGQASSLPNPARARLAVLALADTGFGLLVAAQGGANAAPEGSAEAVLLAQGSALVPELSPSGGASALASMASPGKGKAKGKVAKGAAAAPSASGSAASLALASRRLCLSLGPILAEDWSDSTGAVAAVTSSKANKDKDKVRRPSVGASAVATASAAASSGPSEPTGVAVSKPSSLPSVAGADGLGASPVPSVTVRKLIGDADEEPGEVLGELLRAWGSDDKARHSLHRRVGKARARVGLVAGAVTRMALLAGRRDVVDTVGPCPVPPSHMLLSPSGNGPTSTTALPALATSLAVSVLSTPASALDWASAGGLVEALLQAAVASGQDSAEQAVQARRQYLLLTVAACPHVVGPLASSRALGLLQADVQAVLAARGKAKAPAASTTELLLLGTCLASAVAEAPEADAGVAVAYASLRRAAVDILGSTDSKASGSSTWHGLASALAVATSVVESDASLARTAVVSHAAGLDEDGAAALLNTALLPAVVAAASGTCTTAVAGRLAELCLAVGKACADKGVGLASTAGATAECLTAVLQSVHNRAEQGRSVRPGTVQTAVSLLRLLSLATSSKTTGLGQDDSRKVAAALVAGLRVPIRLSSVQDGVAISTAKGTAVEHGVGVAIVTAAAQAVTRPLWAAVLADVPAAGASAPASAAKGKGKRKSSVAGEEQALASPSSSRSALALLSALIKAVGTGQGSAAAEARSSLAQLTLPAGLVLDHLHQAGLLPVSSTAANSALVLTPAFTNSASAVPVVQALLAPLAAVPGAAPAAVASKRLSTLCLTAEVLAGALADGSQATCRVSEPGLLLPRLWAGLAALVALPAAVAVAEGKIEEEGQDQDGAVAKAGDSSEGDLASGREYACQLLLSCAASYLSAPTVADGDVTGLDNELPVHIARTANSSQTVAAALSVCAALARLHPVAMLQRLLPLLGSVAASAGQQAGESSGPGGWSAVLRVVSAILPSLRTAGPSLGLHPHALLAVFTGVLPTVPVHRRKGLYTSLLHALAGSWGVGVAAGAASSSSSSSATTLHPVAPTAVLLLARALSWAAHAKASASATPAKDKEGKAKGSHAMDVDVDIVPAPRADLVADAGPAFLATVPQTELTDVSSLGHVPELVSSLVSAFSVPQQVAVLAHMLAVAQALIAPVLALDPARLASAMAGTATGLPAPALEEGEAPGQDADVTALLPLVLNGGMFTHAQLAGQGGSALTLPQRVSLCLALLRVASAHVGTKEFLGMVLAVAKREQQLADKGKDSGTAKLQRAYLALSARLFDLLQLAAQGVVASQEARQAQEVVLQAALAEASRSPDTRPRAVHAARLLHGLSEVHGAWSSVQDAGCALLHNMSALLAPAAFVAVIGALLHHGHPGVRARALSFLSDFLRDSYGPAPGPVPDADTRLYVTLVPDIAAAVAAAPGTAKDCSDTNALSHASVAGEAAALFVAYLSRQPAPSQFPEDSSSSAGKEGESKPLTAAARAAALKPLVTALQTTLPVLVSALPSCGPSSLAVLVPCLASLLGSSAKVAVALGPASVPMLPALTAAVLASAEWSVAQAPTPSLPLSALLGLRSSGLSAYRSLLGAMPGFLTGQLPRALRLLLGPAMLGALSLPPAFVRVDRRVTIAADGSPSLSLPGDEGNTEHLAPRAALPALPSGEQIQSPPAPGSPEGVVLDLASSVLSELCDKVEARVLLPALMAVWHWAAAGGDTKGSAAPGHAAPAVLLRCWTRVVNRLDRPAVVELLPRLTPALLTALDLRWLSTPHEAVLRVLGGKADAATEAAAGVLAAGAVAASQAETEASTLVTVLALRLGQKALRPLLARLASWAGAAEADMSTVADTACAEAQVVHARAYPAGAASASDAGYWSFASLARRISYYRLLTGLSSVARAALSPFVTAAIAEASREVVASGQAAREATGAGASAGAGDKRKASDSLGPASKKSRTDGAGVVAGESAISLAGSLSYGPLLPLDSCWNPATLHEAPMPGPGSDAALSAPVPSTVVTVAGAGAAVVPSTPHALRCVALSFLRCALSHESAGSAGPESTLFPQRGTAGQERVEAVLGAITTALKMQAAGQSKAGKAGASAASASAPALYTPLSSPGVPGGQAGLTHFTEAYTLPLVSVLVAASGRDTLWKPVAQAILMSLRDDSARVRLYSLRALAALYWAGGDEALVLLPETLSYLSEVLHDGDTAVEAAANTLLTRLEHTSGEDLQKYLV